MGASRVEHEEIVPNARGLIRTFSGHNYEFGESVADLIDNSLDAGATKIQILMEFDGSNSSVIIADNGDGLAESAIREALRPGTERPYSGDDKGKFGLGLKTASLTHCRRLTVIGRSDPGRRRIAARELDVDDIEKSNKWQVKVVEPPDRAAELLKHTTGTVVVWQKLAKLMGMQNAWGKHAENYFNRLQSDLDDHLSMTFHRFLSKTARRRKPLEIWIGNVKLMPWDPFAGDEKATEDLGEHTFLIAGSKGKGQVVYHPYILPNRSKFSSQKAFDRYGRGNWNARQGFYVYRSDRLIQAGGWSRMRTLDEHTKYARASLEFDRDLDDDFGLNVSKNWVRLPSDLKENLEGEIEKLFRAAKKAYKPDSTSSSGGTLPPPPGNSKGPGKGGGKSGPKEPTGEEPESPPSLRDALEEAASAAGEAPALRKITRKLGKLHPRVARDLGW